MHIIQNEQDIYKIEMYPKVRCFCPLGDGWYSGQITIQFYPEDVIPDYCDIEKWIKENIDGRSLIIEDAVSKIYDFLLKYKPGGLHVIADVKDAGHFPVEVYKK